MREPQPLDGALVTRLDVTDRASIDDAVTQAVDTFETIDALVNNAGYGAYGPLEAFDVERIERQFDTNVTTMPAIARALATSTRTLQRRLSAERTSFQAVLGATRTALAEHYLGRADLTPDQISFLLGYDDPKSFYRAFRGWTGTTPGQVRGQAVVEMR
ncbi:SDR family NAD(P)-dependent oxidoreductase [Dactylosporangium sp. NPDC005572]|uniref:SDR family NAD(P)-dependent oxidoreductase n=1 Tax=Dactylosporangium sp. NPDC005572 TaxID=3156889 RepID=UPI0033A42E7F